MKRIHWVIISVLAAFLFIRGILPAMEGVGTDFPNYYTSARLLVNGGVITRLYDDNWFQQQIYGYGMNQFGKFSPFPPVTAFVMVPLSFFSPEIALRIWTVINLFLLVYAIVLVNEITERAWYWGTTLFLATGHALANNFKFGQLYLALTLLVLIGYRYWIRGKSVPGGVALGLGAAVKYFPALFLLEFIARREWNIIFSFAATLASLTILSIALMGPTIHLQFLQSVVTSHLQGNIQDPFSPTFQSWNSLFRRLFVYDASRNPLPLMNASVAYTLSVGLVYALTGSLLFAGMKRVRRRFGEHGKSVEFALLSIAGLLLLPASATYHFLLLVPPVAILLNGERWTSAQKTLAALYVCIGFIPYSAFDQFASKGIMTILAYPRLILMAALFASSLVTAWNGPESELKTASA